MNFSECMDFISSFPRLGARVDDLSRAEELAALFGNPEKKLKFVHVAGTNGKGSTLEYIANALELSGYKTGKFTSPYVLHYTDRIRINDREIDEESLSEICGILDEKITEKKYSQFEINMMIALLWFVREECDIVVFEAGIGGLLDCTNIIPPPLVSVITSIGLDHTDILGDTVEKIAVQKAGIIKENSAVVCSRLNSDSVIEIIKNAAKSKNSEFIGFDDSFDLRQPPGTFIPHGHSFIYRNEKYQLKMIGAVAQPHNAVTAIEVCRYLNKKGFAIPEENIRKSVETTQVKARLQYIDGKPPVIVDGGHNDDGVFILSCELRHYRYHGKNRYIVMGMSDTKDYVSCAELIAKCSDKIFTVDGFASNAVPAEKLAVIAGEYTSAEACGSLEEAVRKARMEALENNGLMVVCGSLYLASEYLNQYEDLS